jgi:hypothetical protein
MRDSVYGLLASYRGRDELAFETLLPTLHEADRVRDLQVVVPRYAALLQAHLSAATFTETPGTLARALLAVGEQRDGRLLAFFVFEAADVVGGALVASDERTATSLVEPLLRLLDAHARYIATGPTATDRDVRAALAGAAADTLGYAAASSGHRAAKVLAALGRNLPNLEDAAAVLERAGRPFDAARARLWAAEQGHNQGASGSRDVFEGLGAINHLRRLRTVREPA